MWRSTFGSVGKVILAPWDFDRMWSSVETLGTLETIKIAILSNAKNFLFKLLKIRKCRMSASIYYYLYMVYTCTCTYMSNVFSRYHDVNLVFSAQHRLIEVNKGSDSC